MRVKITGIRNDGAVRHLFGHAPSGQIVMFYGDAESFNQLLAFDFVAKLCAPENITYLHGRLAYLLYDVPTHKIFTARR